MKRLRTLSIRDPDALHRRNCASAWGQMYWRNVNLRKHRERHQRAMRGMVVVPCMRVESTYGTEIPEGGADQILRRVIH